MPDPDVILIDMPVLLRDILRTAVLSAGMSIRSEHETVGAALAALDGEVGQLAILGAAEQIDSLAVDTLRARLPAARLLAVAGDGHHATLFAPGHPPAPLDDLSPGGLAAALRSGR